MDAVEALAGVPVVVIVPACVEVAKRAGLPGRFAGLAAIVSAILLVALADLALGSPAGPDAVARWLLLGAVHGLAGAGLYSQVHHLVAGPASGARADTGPVAPNATHPGSALGQRPDPVPGPGDLVAGPTLSRD